MKHIDKIEVTNGKVRMKFVDRDSWGTIRARTQITLNKREFEKALAEADITIPWSSAVLMSHPD